MLPNPNFHSHLPLFFAPFFLIVVAVGILVSLIPYWVIFKKAGFSPWLCILMFVPLVNLITLYYVAFSQWRFMTTPYAYQIPQPPAVYPPRV